jgi:hypothetical protein
VVCRPSCLWWTQQTLPHTRVSSAGCTRRWLARWGQDRQGGQVLLCPPSCACMRYPLPLSPTPHITSHSRCRSLAPPTLPRSCVAAVPSAPSSSPCSLLSKSLVLPVHLSPTPSPPPLCPPPDATRELGALLSKASLDGIPLLVLGNKNDLPGALDTKALIATLGLEVRGPRGGEGTARWACSKDWAVPGLQELCSCSAVIGRCDRSGHD